MDAAIRLAERNYSRSPDKVTAAAYWQSQRSNLMLSEANCYEASVKLACVRGDALYKYNIAIYYGRQFRFLGNRNIFRNNVGFDILINDTHLYIWNGNSHNHAIFHFPMANGKDFTRVFDYLNRRRNAKKISINF